MCVCVCVCVCFGDPCAQNFLNWETILRDFCVEWIIGWVVCWIAFISVFFSSRKIVLKSWLDTSSIPYYLSRFSILFLNAISTPPQYLMDRSSFYSWIWFFVAWYLLDTLTIDDQFLDTYLDSFLDASAIEHYWRVYIYFHHDPSLISSISLNLTAPVHLPNTLFFTPNLFLKVSSSFFKFFYTW